MRPGSRTDGEVFAIPQFSLAQGDVEGFLHELRGFHDAFRDCFARREPREQFFGYMVGPFSALERKSIEPMALQVDGGNVRAMQRLISDVVWDEGQMRRTYHRLLNDDLVLQLHIRAKVPSNHWKSNELQDAAQFLSSCNFDGLQENCNCSTRRCRGGVDI